MEWRERQMTAQHGRCNGCDMRFSAESAKSKRRFPTLDHIVPLSEGGSSRDENLQLLCGKCNSSKGSLPWGDWKVSKVNSNST